MSVVVINRFRISGKQITDSEYLKYQTKRLIYNILQLFNKMFVACVKDSTSNCKFGEFYMAANPLVPEDVLFMHPRTYRDLSLFGRDVYKRQMYKRMRDGDPSYKSEFMIPEVYDECLKG